MFIIKLNAIDSTNSYLKRLSSKEVVKDFTVAITNYQTKGRGQMGTQWSSQDSKNLMFSVFKDNHNTKVEDNFYISMVVAVSILEALEAFKIKNLKIFSKDYI